MIHLVVFDLDGTLVDSVQDLATAVNATVERLAPGTPPLSGGRVRSFVGDGAGRLMERVLAEAGVMVPLERALPVFLDCYRNCLLHTTRLYPGVLETLDRLGGRCLAVLTNKPGDMSRAILHGLGVAHRFERIYGGGDVPGRKPDPAGLMRLLAELEVGADEALMVGDSAVDVRTGRAAGVFTLGVTYGLDPESLKAEPPDVLVDDIRALPDVIADTLDARRPPLLC